MKSLLRIPCLALLAVLLAGVVSAADTQAPDASTTTTTAAKYPFPAAGEIRLIDGDESLRVTREHGAKLLVLNFWASWCAPCVAELPHFQDAYAKYRDRGVLVVGFNFDLLAFDDWKTPALKTMADRKLTFPNLAVDADTSVTFPKFSTDWQGNLPATFYYDAQGNKLGERTGEVTHDELIADIEKYLAR